MPTWSCTTGSIRKSCWHAPAPRRRPVVPGSSTSASGPVPTPSRKARSTESSSVRRQWCGTSVVAVIHDLDLALRSCDRIVVLGGRRRGGPGRPARRGRAWRHRRRVRRRRLRGGDAPRSRLRLLPEGNGRIREGLRIRAAPPPHGLSWTGRVAPAMSFHPGWRMAAERGTL